MILHREGNALIDIEADGIANFLEGDGHLVFYGFHREIEDLRYFPVLQPIFFYQFEDDLAFGRKLIDGSFYQRDHIGRDPGGAFYRAPCPDGLAGDAPHDMNAELQTQ